MKTIGIIGGSGFYELPFAAKVTDEQCVTPYGKVEGIHRYSHDGVDLLFIPRHGKNRNIPPHRVNYRANIDAICSLGAQHLLTFNAVGSIDTALAPGDFVVPHQIIDYTYGREQSFCDGQNALLHIDFEHPFDAILRRALVGACEDSGEPVHDKGIYACTQGPRLETAAEILRLERDGADIVGMTAMPEAALARERGLPYGMLCCVVNYAAGKDSKYFSLDSIMARLQTRVPIAAEIISRTHRFF